MDNQNDSAISAELVERLRAAVDARDVARKAALATGHRDPDALHNLADAFAKLGDIYAEVHRVAPAGVLEMAALDAVSGMHWEASDYRSWARRAQRDRDEEAKRAAAPRELPGGEQ